MHAPRLASPTSRAHLPSPAALVPFVTCASAFFARRLLLRVFSVGVCLVALVAAPSTSRADSPFDGKWVQGPLKETYTILKWQKECEAPPVDGASGGGESIRISTDGDELSFVGGGRVFKTNQCYDQMPTLARESHTRNPSGKEWRTRCSTPPSDPRHAVMNTLVAATSASHLDIIETGRYESQLAGGLCTADVKRSRGFDLVAADSPAASVSPPVAVVPRAAAPPPAVAGDPGRCSAPGDPTRLEARPVPEAPSYRRGVRLSRGRPRRERVRDPHHDHLGHRRGGRQGALGGRERERHSCGGRAGGVVRRRRQRSRQERPGDGPGGRARALRRPPSAIGAERRGRERRRFGRRDRHGANGGRRRARRGWIGESTGDFLSVIGFLALALAGVAVVATGRTKRAVALEREAQNRHAERVQAAEARRREKVAQHAAAMRAHEESVEQAKRATESAVVAAEPPAALQVCPTCRQEFNDASAFCPNDATRLVRINASVTALPPSAGGICPTCKRGYDAGVKVCPHDRDELVPYALYASLQPAVSGPTTGDGSAGARVAPRGKICPTCGGRYEGVVEFCGKDGTALVLLN